MYLESLRTGKKTVLFSVPVNLIRQWCYCPRIVYYLELTPFSVAHPRWVEQGEQFHEKETKLWLRRNLRRFHLEGGKVHLGVSAGSARHQIHGIADMVIETADAVYPVEFKLAESVQKRGGILQLVAYGMILEDTFTKKSPFGFLTEEKKKISWIELSEARRKDVLLQVRRIREMLDKGVKPDSPATIHQCMGCEYRNHCNDRV